MVNDIELGLKVSKKVFRQIYDQYFNALCAFSYRYIPDVQSVEDLVQEAFLYLWENKDSFNNDLAIKSFLYTTVRNKCLNQLKHTAVELKHEKHLLYEKQSEQEFNHHVIEEETFNILFREIQSLPRSAQKIILLALNGLKNPEIAAELNISLNTVKTQKKIAYAKLKEKLKPLVFLIILSV